MSNQESSSQEINRKQLTDEQVGAIVKAQTTFWIVATLFATFFALFAKLIWTLKFPILILLPIAMLGFSLGSLNTLRATLAQFVDSDQADA